jgi:hypothetical protein
LNIFHFTVLSQLQISANLFACALCRKEFNSRGNAVKHLRTHGLGLEPLAERTCPHCAKIFPFVKGCRRHAALCAQEDSPRCHACQLDFENAAAFKGTQAFEFLLLVLLQHSELDF